MVSRVMIMLALLLTVFRADAAEVSVQADRHEIALNESFRLSFETAGALQSPDLSPLEKDFEIVGRAQSSNVTMTNGAIRRTTVLNLDLMAKRAGTLMVPPMRFGKTQTEPLEITVREQSPQQGGALDDVFIEVAFDPAQPYVQGQIIYTIRFFRAVSIATGRLSEPDLGGVDALIERVGDDATFESPRGDRRYQVTERRYAIFPQAPGTLNIAPVIFDGRIGSSLLFDPFNDRSRQIRVKSEPVSIAVAPPPAAAGEGAWLPAESLQLHEVWSDDPPQFRVGEPITRTVALIAQGLTSRQLPEIPMPLPEGFKLYPDQPALADQSNSKGIIGVRQEKIALVPSRAGEFTFPAITLSWWNTQTDKAGQAHLPERKVVVANAEPAARSGPPGAAGRQPTTAAAARPQSAPAAARVPPDNVVPWMIATAVLGGAWLVTGLVWWWRARQARREKAAAQEPEKFNRRSLRLACRNNDAAAVKDALLLWTRVEWPNERIGNLEQLKCRASAEMRTGLTELNAALYGNKGRAWRGGEALWRAFVQQCGAAREPGREHDGPGRLEPLYKR